MPARGGSKRIKKKNIKNFCGKPIIAWSIELAISSKCFDNVIVSTDDLEIAKIAKNYGADVPFIRPKEISDDFTTIVNVISHAIKLYSENNQKPSYTCCIFATAPFLKIKDLKKGFNILKKTKCEYTFAATSYSHPIQRSFKINKNNKITKFYTRHANTRSQDLEKTFHDIGQFYWGTTKTWLKNKPIISSKSQPL